MQKISPFLWFDGKAEEAARFYTDEKSNRVMQAMLKMDKIEIEGLKQAYDGKDKLIKTAKHKSQ